jgi:replicative DNA helicase
MFMTEEIERRLDSISNNGAERAVLSIILEDPEELFEVATKIAKEDFNNTANKLIYEIILTIFDNKYANIGKVNPMIIYALAQNNGVEEQIGGMQYLQMLQRTEAGKENLHFYIEKVRQASVRREAFRNALSVMEDAVNSEDEDTSEFIARQEEKFLDMVMENDSNGNEVFRIGDIIDAVIEKKETNQREILGVPTGFAEYDKATGGLVPSRLKVIGAVAKTGKSAHAINVAKNIAVNEKVPVLYIDTEMPTEEQIDRLLSILSLDTGNGVPEQMITKGTYANNAKFKGVIDDYARPILRDAPLFHVYMPDFTPEKIYNLCRKFQRQHGIEWNGYQNQFVLIFDYIKLDEDSLKKNIQEYLVLGQITNMLKNKVAGMLGIPVLAYAQINPRTGHNAEDINSSHMSGSNRIVMFVNELSFIRKKTEEELTRTGIEGGNVVWKVGESRNGGSYEGWIDYTIRMQVPAMREIRNVAVS